MLLFVAPALAAPAVDGTVLAGARTAPESAIQVPSAWEGTFEPSGLLSAEVRARFGGTDGPWATAAVGGWGYGPDLDASLAGVGVGLGWSGKGGASVAGRYDAQVFPLLVDATNGRAELVAGLARPVGRWALAGELTGVDRRFVGEAGFSTAEAGAVLSTPEAAWGLDAGASGQANAAVDGPVGAQARTLLRLRVGGERWHLAVEHRLIVALEGEAEGETRAAFTPLGDYADDVDALSGGGFLQNRVGASGAVGTGAWTVSAGGFARFRVAEVEEEAAVAFARTWTAQARVERALGDTVSAFVAGGAAGAALGTGGGGYVDAFGWVGLDVRSR